MWAAAAKSLQSCPTLCNPMDGSPPGSPIPEILQARTLEWVAISSSNAWKWKVKVKLLSHVRLVATPWTAAYQAPLSMGFSRQEDWSGVPLLSPVIISSIYQNSLWIYNLTDMLRFCCSLNELLIYFAFSHFKLSWFLFANSVFAFFVAELWLLKLGSRSPDSIVALPSCSKTSTLLAIYPIIPQ